MESEDCVTQGQGPEMTVSSLGRARFTVPRGQRLRMAKPVRAGMGERAGGLAGRWLSRDRDQRQPKWELEPVEDPECRHQPIEEASAAQPPQPEQSNIDQPAERAHRIAAADPLDGKAARLQFAPELSLGVATVMADVAVERAEEAWVARHEERERPAWLEERIHGLQGPLVIGDVLEDVDTDRRIETVTAECLDRLGEIMPADDDVGTILEPVARFVNVVVDHVDPDDQLAINHEAGDGARATTDLEDTLAQAVADPIVDPAVVSVGAFHDFEGRGSGCQVHVASLQMETPPSWLGVAPVRQVKEAIIRSR